MCSTQLFLTRVLHVAYHGTERALTVLQVIGRVAGELHACTDDRRKARSHGQWLSFLGGFSCTRLGWLGWLDSLHRPHSPTKPPPKTQTVETIMLGKLLISIVKIHSGILRFFSNSSSSSSSPSSSYFFARSHIKVLILIKILSIIQFFFNWIVKVSLLWSDRFLVKKWFV